MRVLVGTEVAHIFPVSFPDKSDKRFIMFSTLPFSEASTGTSTVLYACNMCGRDAKKSVKRLDKPEYANIIAASRKPQAASRKPQAASRKPQAASRKPQANMKVFSVIQR
ncbi:MAG: hypothetical protein LBO79_08235 [Zoogloeaceae bacterium]|nr:hypothetical protein [Zoogloeaceae bacterium]